MQGHSTTQADDSPHSAVNSDHKSADHAGGHSWEPHITGESRNVAHEPAQTLRRRLEPSLVSLNGGLRLSPFDLTPCGCLWAGVCAKAGGAFAFGAAAGLTSIARRGQSCPRFSSPHRLHLSTPAQTCRWQRNEHADAQGVPVCGAVGVARFCRARGCAWLRLIN